ncbi:Gll1843 protein [uncultured Candidatus Thioglobus sp.]|nr:Gll1843 protein [uncultured Candidatus Thioglobus sp.]
MDNLSHIKIKGFKSIKELDLKMKPINVLIGANGSGKSNFISIFEFLNHLERKQEELYVLQNGGADGFFHFGAKHTDRIVFDLTVNKNHYKTFFVKGTSKDTLLKGIEESSSLDGFTKGHSWNLITPYLKGIRSYHFHDTSPDAKFKSYQDIGQNKFLDSFASNLAPFLYRLKNYFPQDYKNIVQAVQTVAPYFQDFDFNIEGENILLRWQHTNDLSNLGFSAQTLSDGTARFICMATLFLQPKELRPATIVLDEPEIGLHPDALTVLSEVIKAVANDGAQVIISTQSVTLANCFEPDDFIVVDYEDGESKFERFGKEKQEKLKDWLEDYQMGTTWEENMLGGMPK